MIFHQKDSTKEQLAATAKSKSADALVQSAKKSNLDISNQEIEAFILELQD